MAVAFDAVGPSSAGAGTSGATTSTTASWSHTCTGSNLVVVVGVAVGGSTDSVTESVTFGGTSMTSLGLVHSNNGTVGFVELFGLVGPPTGASTVAVTITSAMTISAGSVSFTGAASFGTATTAFGASATASIVKAGTTSGNMVVDAMCCGTSATSSSQTNRWLKNTNTNSAAGNGAGSTAAAGGSVTMSYTISSDWWGIVAVEVLAAGAASAPVYLPTVAPSLAAISRSSTW